MGLWIGEQLGRDLPQTDKTLLLIVETDGCLVDGLAVATGCRVGRRTLRIEDYGKWPPPLLIRLRADGAGGAAACLP